MRMSNKTFASAILAGSALLLTAGIASAQSVVNLTAARQTALLPNGAWYGGSPYLGPDATQRSQGATPIPPSGTVANSPTDEAGFSFMWHSHNEREITTDNVFPGGMLMMMLVDPPVWFIDETL